MKNKEDISITQTLYVAVLLTLVGGFLESYTFVLHGNVFCNAQTGNMVLIAINIANGKFVQAFYYFVPVVSFAFAVLVSEFVKRQWSALRWMVWEQIILAFEIVLLFAIGFLPQAVPNPVISALIAFVCAMQVCSFRSVKGLTYATTMCTGNLRSGMQLLFKYMKDKERTSGVHALHYFVIIFTFIIGGGVGVLLSRLFSTHSIWACCAILIAVFIMISMEYHNKSALSGDTVSGGPDD